LRFFGQGGFLNQKHEEAKKQLEEVNRRLNEMEEQGMRTGFADATVKSIEKILGIVAEMERKGEKQCLEIGGFRQGHARPGYSLGIQVGMPDVKEMPVERKPLLQVFEDGKNLRIAAEFPGVKEREIEVNLAENGLIIKIPKEGFGQKITLPKEMRLLGRSFRNCVLELRLEKLF